VPAEPFGAALAGGTTTVALTDDNNGWASGYSGTFKLSGGTWSVDSPTDLSGGVELTGAGTGWASSWYNGIYRLSGGVWSKVDPGFDADVYGAYSMDMVDDDNGFISVCDEAKVGDAHLRDVVISPESGRALIIGDGDTRHWL